MLRLSRVAEFEEWVGVCHQPGERKVLQGEPKSRKTSWNIPGTWVVTESGVFRSCVRESGGEEAMHLAKAVPARTLPVPEPYSTVSRSWT